MVRTIFSALSILLLSSTSALASPITAEQTAFKQVISYNDAQEEIISYVPAELVKPGDVVRYNLRVTNVSETPVTDVKLVSPVPKTMDLLESQIEIIRGDVNAKYSVDGGETFMSLPEARMQRQTDGRVQSPAKITHIQWVSGKSLNAQDFLALNFFAKLR